MKPSIDIHHPMSKSRARRTIKQTAMDINETIEQINPTRSVSLHQQVVLSIRDSRSLLNMSNRADQRRITESVKFRAFRKIPVPAYQNDVKVILNNQSKTPDNINDLIDYYNSTLQNLTDKYAPLQRKKIALRHSPW